MLCRMKYRWAMRKCNISLVGQESGLEVHSDVGRDLIDWRDWKYSTWDINFVELDV